jgi:hypothetical protein
MFFVAESIGAVALTRAREPVVNMAETQTITSVMGLTDAILLTCDRAQFGDT